MTDEYADEQETREGRTVYWVGRQWCVTEFGLETIIDQRYYVEASILGGLTEGEDRPIAERLRHIGTDKSWVDGEDLIAAFAVALAVHAGKYTPLPEGAFLNAVNDVRRVKWIGKHVRENRAPGQEHDWMAGFQSSGHAADEREREMPFHQLPDPHPGYAEERRIIESDETYD